LLLLLLLLLLEVGLLRGDAERLLLEMRLSRRDVELLLLLLLLLGLLLRLGIDLRRISGLDELLGRRGLGVEGELLLRRLLLLLLRVRRDGLGIARRLLGKGVDTRRRGRSRKRIGGEGRVEGSALLFLFVLGVDVLEDLDDLLGVGASIRVLVPAGLHEAGELEVRSV